MMPLDLLAVLVSLTLSWQTPAQPGLDLVLCAAESPAAALQCTALFAASADESSATWEFDLEVGEAIFIAGVKLRRTEGCDSPLTPSPFRWQRRLR